MADGSIIIITSPYLFSVSKLYNLLIKQWKCIVYSSPFWIAEFVTLVDTTVPVLLLVSVLWGTTHLRRDLTLFCFSGSGQSTRQAVRRV